MRMKTISSGFVVLAMVASVTACSSGGSGSKSTPAAQGTLPAPPTASVRTPTAPPIVVGTPSPTPVPATPIAVGSTPIAASTITYTVVAGDSPFSIAAKLGVPADQTTDWSQGMLALNNMSAYELQIGQVLKLPANTPEHPPTPTPSPPATGTPGTPPPPPPPGSTVSPANTPAAAATPVPTAASQGPAGLAGVTIVSLTSPVARGAMASLRAQSLPNLSCAIAYTNPGKQQSIADGLVTKSTDASGAVSWSWVIAPNTQPGTGSVAVSCGTQATSADLVIQ